MEVRIDLFGVNDVKEDRVKWDLYGSAFFLMVAKSDKDGPQY